MGKSPEASEHVVLVHGLLRTPRSWSTLRRHLEREGFTTGVFGYPSLTGRFEVHGRGLARELKRLDADRRLARVHLVGHSLGNLVIRAALAERPLRKLGRVVMLVPPNHGSPVARKLARWLGDLVPVLKQLSDEPDSDARRLAFPRMEAGVIAARFDHVVTRASTHAPGEADHLLVTALHGFVMYQPDVQRAIVEFLRTGRFGGGAKPALRRR
jgi:triacylglycerol lipase